MLNLDLNSLPFKTLELEEGQLPDGALLIVRSHMDEGRTRYSVLVTEGMDYATALGLVQIMAQNIEDGELFVDAEEGE